MGAAVNDHVKCMELLLQARADVNAKDKSVRYRMTGVVQESSAAL